MVARLLNGSAGPGDSFGEVSHGLATFSTSHGWRNACAVVSLFSGSSCNKPSRKSASCPSIPSSLQRLVGLGYNRSPRRS